MGKSRRLLYRLFHRSASPSGIGVGIGVRVEFSSITLPQSASARCASPIGSRCQSLAVAALTQAQWPEVGALKNEWELPKRGVLFLKGRRTHQLLRLAYSSR